MSAQSQIRAAVPVASAPLDNMRSEGDEASSTFDWFRASRGGEDE